MAIQLLTDYEKTRLSERQPLPDDVPPPVGRRAGRAHRGRQRARSGDRVVHPRPPLSARRGHQVRRRHRRLAEAGAARPPASGDAEFVVFCGVHFMAESADVLSAPRQQVILPDLAAGCSMADMAAIDQLEVCWDELARLGVTEVVPVTYINSTAAIKAFCGEHGGIVCTSSNADAVMAWAWDRGEKMLMLPDQHLGRNTAFRMGVPLDEMVLWDPELPFGGVERGRARPRAAHPLEGPLQRAHALQRPADRAVPSGASRRQGHRPSRVHVRRGAGRRRRAGRPNASFAPSTTARRDRSGRSAPKSTS